MAEEDKQAKQQTFKANLFDVQRRGLDEEEDSLVILSLGVNTGRDTLKTAWATPEEGRGATGMKSRQDALWAARITGSLIWVLKNLTPSEWLKTYTELFLIFL